MASSSLSTSTHRWKYDVFVSFRDEDIGKGFMDHLFSDFKRKGIHAFREDDHIRKGEDITSQIYEAIEKSRILVVVFSQNYASSTKCLSELKKIFECKEKEKEEEKEKKDQYEIRPIFYDVKPYMVRYQAGSFEAAFKEHEASKKKEVPEWKEALAKAADLSGLELQDKANG